MSYILDKLQYICYNKNIKTGYRKEELLLKNMKLILARTEREMTQGELAAAVGITRQTVSLIEKGEYNPSLRLCITICKALGKTLDDLFWVDGDER